MEILSIYLWSLLSVFYYIRIEYQLTLINDTVDIVI